MIVLFQRGNSKAGNPKGEHVSICSVFCTLAFLQHDHMCCESFQITFSAFLEHIMFSKLGNCSVWRHRTFNLIESLDSVRLIQERLYCCQRTCKKVTEVRKHGGDFKLSQPRPFACKASHKVSRFTVHDVKPECKCWGWYSNYHFGRELFSGVGWVWSSCDDSPFEGYAWHAASIINGEYAWVLVVKQNNSVGVQHMCVGIREMDSCWNSQMR